MTDLFDKAGLKHWPNEENLIEWDVAVDVGKTVKFECKFDKMAARTGNMAIEHWNSKKDKPSGITATEADIWAVVLDPDMQVFATSVESLRRYCKENTPHKSVHGGDNNSHMWLYKTDRILEDIFTPLSEVSPEKLVEVILITLT